VAGLLEGRTGALIEQLDVEMAGLAAQMKFEEAAVIRDRIKGLKAYSERQKVVTLDPVDRDIFGISAEDDSACGVIFRVREGKMIGRRHYYMSGVAGKPQAEILETVLQQHYLDAGDLPPEILLPGKVEDAGTIGEWLAQKKGGPVALIHPEEGEDAKLVRLAVQNAAFLLGDLKLQRLKRATQVPHTVAALQKDLRLTALPKRIECFDISNVQGADAVASMVVFIDGKPRKSEYRKFRIRTVVGPDDFASMREVIERRYTRLKEEQGELPDLVIVDGGKGQLSAAVEVLTRLELPGLPIIGLAKRLEEIFLPGGPEPVVLPKASASLQLLQRIRDEAHRFAITYHRSLRARRTLQTELDLIKGVGEKRAKELLEAFGSVQGVKFATSEQLGEIVGEKVAENIKEYFEEARQD
jgi:excinuclease ABC subunit C